LFDENEKVTAFFTFRAMQVFIKTSLSQAKLAMKTDLFT